MPVFLLLVLGVILKLTRFIDDAFIQSSSKLVFNIALPAFIFFELSVLRINEAVDFKMLAFIYAFTLITFFVGWIISSSYVKHPKDKGAFIQGSFRGNFAIVGLAVIYNTSGTAGAAKAALILGFLLPLYNVLAVIALSINNTKGKKISPLKLMKEIFTNPLILSVIVAIPFSYFEIKPYEFIEKSGKYISSISLPLALISIGGSLNIESIKNSSFYAVLSSSLKIIFSPLAATLAAIYVGYSGMDLMIIFVLFSCPTAVVSFIMAEAMGSNEKLAGNIIVITTIGFIFTMSLGIYLLREFGY